jgi:hypothetical protein
MRSRLGDETRKKTAIGRVCFNDACQVEDNPKFNGTTTTGRGGGISNNVIIAPVGQDEPPFRDVVDECLQCPGLIMSMEIGTRHTSTFNTARVDLFFSTRCATRRLECPTRRVQRRATSRS